MNISIIVPCYNEEKNIGPCLNSLIGQKYSDPFEIIVIDNNSQDKSQKIISDYLKSHSCIRLITEKKRGTAAARNTGIKNSRYDIVAFIDADCVAPQNWLMTLVDNYTASNREDKNVAGVGGRNIAPHDSSPFVKAIEIALDSYLGSFSSIQGRQYRESALVSSLSMSNAMYKKEKMVEIGCFDESLQSESEDAEINFRLITAGNRLFYVPDSYVWHNMRSSPKLWFKNMFRYGKGRARLLKRYPKMWRFSFLLPLIFLISMFSIFLSVFHWMFALPALYFLFIALFSFLHALRKKVVPLVLFIFTVFIVQHFGYAIGEFYGFANLKIK